MDKPLWRLLVASGATHWHGACRIMMMMITSYETLRHVVLSIDFQPVQCFVTSTTTRFFFWPFTCCFFFSLINAIVIIFHVFAALRALPLWPSTQHCFQQFHSCSSLRNRCSCYFTFPPCPHTHRPLSLFVAWLTLEYFVCVCFVYP